MKNKNFFYIWGGLFIVCAILGFIPQPEGFLKGFLLLISILFFIPGWLLLFRAAKNKDISLLKTICILCLISLGSTLFFLVLNFMSGSGSQAAGNLLYGFLVIFSSPMVCSQYWIVSLFLWACCLMNSNRRLMKSVFYLEDVIISVTHLT